MYVRTDETWTQYKLVRCERQFWELFHKVIKDAAQWCVTGGEAGVDHPREQRKLEARKRLENAQSLTCRLHALLGRFCKTVFNLSLILIFLTMSYLYAKL